ncbi:MAG TPA: hypothetical protein VK473_18160 [Terriglobales bacterium]|nr:hypothetical protein [Terriglobales bacterium]
MKRGIACVLSFALVTSAFAIGDPPDPQAAPAKKTKPATGISAEVQQLREALEAQQKQIEELRREVQRRDQVLQQAQQQAGAAQSAANAAQASAEAAAAASAGQKPVDLTALQADVADLKANSTSTALSLQETQKTIRDMESPAAIHYKGITITPGGFIEFATVFRTRNENASVNSASGDFNIPLDGTTNAKMSEFRFDARQSRLSVLAEGKIGTTKASGYFEMDFLGAAPTSNENQSNSFVFRQRQLWAQVEFPNGVSMLGGQAFTLFTLNRRGIDPRGVFLPMTINAQYMIGYDWARQPGFRITKNFHNRTWAAFSIENPSTVLNASGVTIAGVTGATPAGNIPPIFGFNTSPNATSPNGNFVLNNTPGANGVSTNVAPDVIGKLVFEPGFGHWEIKGMARFFRDRFRGNNDTNVGGGLGGAAIIPVVKTKLDLVAEALWGNGIGRYGSGGGIDVTLRPDGTIRPIRAYHTLLGPEAHVGKKLDIYFYGGYEYYQRVYTTVAGPPFPAPATASTVGYGSPTQNNTGCASEMISAASLSCGNQTRYAYELSPGFWYRFYRGPAGTVQMGAQYSFSNRALWRGTGGAPSGNENQFYTSLRYYIP